MAVNDVAKMRTSNRIAVRVRSSPSPGGGGGAGFFREASSEADVEEDEEGAKVASEAVEAAALSLLAMEVDVLVVGSKSPIGFRLRLYEFTFKMTQGIRTTQATAAGVKSRTRVTRLIKNQLLQQARQQLFRIGRSRCIP